MTFLLNFSLNSSHTWLNKRFFPKLVPMDQSVRLSSIFQNFWSQHCHKCIWCRFFEYFQIVPSLSDSTLYIWTCKCYITGFCCGLFCDPFTTRICDYILLLPRFCSGALAFAIFWSWFLSQLQKFVQVAYYPMCLIIQINIDITGRVS